MPGARRGGLYATLEALYGLLNVTGVTTLATGGVHQAQAPHGEVRDYVLIQSPEAAHWDSMQTPGEETTVQVVACTLGPDSGPAIALAQAAIQAVDGERPTIDAHHLCIALQFQRIQVVPEPDLIEGQTAWRAVVTFRMLVDQIS